MLPFAGASPPCLVPQGLFATYATKHDIKLEWSHLLQEEVARAYNTDGGFRSITNSIIMRSAFNKLREACDPFLELGTLRGRTFSFDYSEGQVAVLNGRTPLASHHVALAVQSHGGAQQCLEWLHHTLKMFPRYQLSVCDVVLRLAAFIFLYYMPGVLLKQYLLS